jgi:hypothetical protein
MFLRQTRQAAGGCCSKLQGSLALACRPYATSGTNRGPLDRRDLPRRTRIQARSGAQRCRAATPGRWTIVQAVSCETTRGVGMQSNSRYNSPSAARVHFALMYSDAGALVLDKTNNNFRIKVSTNKYKQGHPPCA